MTRREQVFWGWGEPFGPDRPSLPDHASDFLRSELGVSAEVVDRPAALEDVRLGESALPGALRKRLEEVVGAPNVRDDREARVLRAAGKSYLDLLAMRAGDASEAPDAVVAPDSHDEVLAVLQACNEENVAVVPFGGGTSVVGGVAPLRDGRPALISLDLGRMDGVIDVDERSLTARIAPGMRLPEADRALASRGLTLGHFPQSYEWATVGGCVAARSAGQASSGFGRIDSNVVAVRLASPAGELATIAVPASASGPALRQLVCGSEGILGVVTEATLRVHRVASERRFEGWFFKSFQEGWEAFRGLVQAGVTPAVARLSDEAETRMSLALAGGHGLKARIGSRVLSARGYAEGCVAILGWEGRDSRPRAATKLLRSAGGMAVGSGPGASWLASRYAGPHLRDDLLDRGVMVETLETATTWSNLARLYRAVGGALSGHLVMCHVSHLYPTGASLYFTVMAARDPRDPVGQWTALKDAACRAILAAGGTLSHHHAIGRDHAAYLGGEVGHLGLEVLRAVKDRLDPAGIMNPGKLIG